MPWEVRQTNKFARVYKRLNDSTAKAVDQAVELIAENPGIGEKKSGDLAKLWVYKFKHQGQLYLLGYTKDKQICMIYLEAIGPHENFYRKLKN
jgi:mRNA-degrading endonuclease RelE of RelBE toxin-antitoxin system